MKHGMNDTDPKAEAVQMEILRKMSPAKKLAQADELSVWARHACLRALRRRHHDETEGQVRRRYAELVLGKELAERVYGPVRRDD